MDKLVGQTFKVRLKPSDIKIGCENKADKCPVAQAVNRSISGFFGAVYNEKISVTADTISFNVNRNPKSAFTFENTRHLSGWIANYDEGIRVEPIDFSMTVKSQSTHNDGTTMCFDGTVNNVR